MITSTLLFIGSLCLLTGSLIQAFSLSQLTVSNSSQAHGNSIVQQNLTVAPPFPILQIGWQHIQGQIGANATKAENESIAAERNANLQRPTRQAEISPYTSLEKRDTPAQCSIDTPCIDFSCCNSVSTT